MSKKTITKNKLLDLANKKRQFKGVSKKSCNLKSSDKSTLYRLVYTSRFSVFASLLLLISFVFQGAQISYAAEISDSPNEVPEIVTETTEENLSDQSLLGDTIDEVVDVESAVEGFGSESKLISELTDAPTPETSGSNEADDDLVETEISGETNQIDTSDNTDNDLVVDISTSTDNFLNEDGDGLGSTTDDVDYNEEEFLDDSSLDPLASSTEEVIESQDTTEIISITNSASVFSFNQNQCTELASGSFYCHRESTNTLKDALFAAPDDGGDSEIFMVKDGKQAQITKNTFDDLAPYYDSNSNTLVWHRLINDRYQIISYDLETEKETQLTRTNENNMEPTRQGKYTVWQRWIDGGWNIILHDGDGETQLTKTNNPDVAPYVHGSLVVWNRYNNDGDKTIEMYDIASQTFVSIKDPDGMSVSNPRMVFVYDSLHPNGDVVTKGYDVLSQKFIDLDTLPRSLPAEIPDNDSTGETRALIQSKPSIKSEFEESIDKSRPVLPPEPQDATSTLEEIDNDLTLDLSSEDTNETVLVEATSTPPSTDYDLVIPPFAAATTSEEGV